MVDGSLMWRLVAAAPVFVEIWIAFCSGQDFASTNLNCVPAWSSSLQTYRIFLESEETSSRGLAIRLGHGRRRALQSRCDGSARQTNQDLPFRDLGGTGLVLNKGVAEARISRWTLS